MACTLSSRSEVASLVIATVKGIRGINWELSESSQIDRDLGLDSLAARHLLYRPVADAIVSSGCVARHFHKSHCAQAKKVKDIVDAAWASVKRGRVRAAKEATIDELTDELRKRREALANAKSALEAAIRAGEA